jgi:hypothetical protein
MKATSRLLERSRQPANNSGILPSMAVATRDARAAQTVSAVPSLLNLTDAHPHSVSVAPLFAEPSVYAHGVRHWGLNE